MSKGITKAVVRYRLKSIEKLFKATDWIPNKIITGEWTSSDKRWQAYLEKRAENRSKQDELSKHLLE